MPKFGSQPTPLLSPIASTGRTFTHEGGIGVERDTKSELFLLAATNMVAENAFYETAGARDARFETLIHQVTAEDPGWVARFVPYLRDEMQMRSASIVMAAEYVKAGGPHGRSVVAEACKRADEPGEMLAYWHLTHGRSVPAAVKRGVADAVVRLYNERNALRYDGNDRTWRFADVIELAHPKPSAQWQSDLFRFLIDKRHNRADTIPETLPIIAADRSLLQLPEGHRRESLGLIDKAGWSWERLSGWLPGGMDAEAWDAVIPNMGYMALLRNLRNFDQAGVSDAACARVCERLADPEQVAKSRQFPFRFYSAFKEIGSLRWAGALERALDLSLANVPGLPGKTLILVDCSGSMQDRMSGRSQRARWELAGLFGVALGKRAAHADVVAYGTDGRWATETLQRPLLQAVNEFGPNMGGTNTMGVLNAAYAGQDRVVILTDEQAHDAGIPVPDVPIYTFNLAGYHAGHLLSGVRNRYTFGGLNDAAFRLVSMIERVRDTSWPF